MCSTITCFFILQYKLAALVWVTNFGRFTVILPVKLETGQEIIFRTSDILPVQEHKGFIGAFIEVSKLRDTLNISAIYSLGQVLQKEDRNEKWYIFLAGWLVGEGRNATPGGGQWCCCVSLKAKQIARVRCLDVHVNKSLYLNNFKKNISPVFMSILKQYYVNKYWPNNPAWTPLDVLYPLEPLPFNFNRTIFVLFCLFICCCFCCCFFVLNC